MTDIIILLFGKKNNIQINPTLLKVGGPENGIHNLIFVDNNLISGKPGDIEKLVKRKKFGIIVKVIRNKRNLGFAGGCNVGIREALGDGAKSVFLLNQDAVFEPGCLEALLKNPADIVAPVIRFKRNGRWVYDHGGKINWWLGRTWHVEHLKNPPHGKTLVRPRDYAEEPVDYVSGCAMLIRRNVLEKIGLFDERFFLYFEDADFCLRARRAGFKIAVEPKALVTHHILEKEKKPFWQQKEMLKSNLLFINRWVPSLKKPVAYLYWSVLSLKVLVRNLIK